MGRQTSLYFTCLSSLNVRGRNVNRNVPCPHVILEAVCPSGDNRKYYGGDFSVYIPFLLSISSAQNINVLLAIISSEGQTGVLVHSGARDLAPPTNVILATHHLHSIYLSAPLIPPPPFEPSTMAFILRRPFAITATLKQTSRPAQSIGFRAFHNTHLKQQPNFFTSKTQSLTPSVSKSHNVFRAAFQRRSYQQTTYNPVAQGDARQRLLYGAGIFGATLLGINFMFNRETREDGGMPPFERAYLNDTFMHTGLGIGIIGVAARTLHMNGWSFRLMSASPWLVLGVGLVGSIGTMYGCMATNPQK